MLEGTFHATINIIQLQTYDLYCNMPATYTNATVAQCYSHVMGVTNHFALDFKPIP